MRVAIIGCGLIGNKRARHLGNHILMVAADTDITKARRLVSDLSTIAGGAQTTNDWRAAVQRNDVDAVIIATTPNVMPEIALAALRAGKHVLVDKPAACHYLDLVPVAEMAQQTGLIVRVGFNHRYHPALQKARQLVDAGAVDDLLYIRGRYGHGGRIGYEKEWRANKAVSGGGELLDQGSHLIDLSRWFLGDFRDVLGCAPTYFWDMKVDDNAFMMLRTESNQVAWLHASWTEWKNLFCFEIFGRGGKIQIDGLGGSYGVETLTFYKMKPELGPPDIERFEFPGEDRSWQLEFDDFVKDVQTGRCTGPTADDALAVLKVVDRIYSLHTGPLVGVT